MDQAHVNLGRSEWEERKKIFFADGQDGANSLLIKHERDSELGCSRWTFAYELGLTASMVMWASQQPGVPILRSFE